jgi:hypothetical protein
MAQFILLEKSTKNVLNWNLDTLEDQEVWLASILQSLDPSLEIVCNYEPYERPLVDERLINVIVNGLNGNGSYVDEPHPDFPTVKQWLVTYTTENKSTTEQKAAVDVAESNSIETNIPVSKRNKTIYLALDSLLDYIGYTETNSPLNNKKKKQIRIFRHIANHIRENDKAKDDKYILIEGNNNPDLDNGWDLNDYDENV